MKEILIRLLIAAFLMFAAFALSLSARGQQMNASFDPAVETTQKPEASAESHASPDAQATPVAEVLPPDDEQTQDALVFTGQITPQKGMLILTDPITRVSYQLDDQVRAKPFVGRQVRVIGKLKMRTNTICVEAIRVSH